MCLKEKILQDLVPLKGDKLQTNILKYYILLKEN